MKRLLRSKLVLTMAALVMIAATIFIVLPGNITHSYAASGFSIVPSVNPSSATNELYATSAYSVDNVWAVGTYNYNNNVLIEHWDGTSWTQQIGVSPGVNGNILYGVKAFSATDIWAVGAYEDSGNSWNVLIEHTTDGGSTWLQDTSSYTGHGFLYAIDGTSSDAWAVGTDGNGNALTLQLSSGHFSQQSNVSPNSNITLYGMSEDSSSDVWAVGVDGSSTFTMHYDGSSWTSYTSPNYQPSGYNYLYGVTAIASNDAWAVGYSISTGMTGTLIHWDGSAWSSSVLTVTVGTSSRLNAVTAFSSNSIWAVGYYSSSGITYPLVWQSSDGGSTWSQVSTESVTSQNYFFGVTIDGTSGNIWAVGYYTLSGNDNTLIEQYMPSPTPTVTVQKVWTADGNNNTQTSYTPGDAIQYEAQVNNTNSTTVTATFTFLATGPRQIFSWSGSKSVASGTSTISLASTVPFDALEGQYTLTVTVAYNGVSSQGQSQFTITRPSNPVVNNLKTDAQYDQSETTIAVSSVNSPGLTVMVSYNDFLPGENTGYSYSFDGGTSWTDGGAPPVYQDKSGNGVNGGDPALTVDKNGTFYLAQIEYTANAKEFIGMSQCTYLSSTGRITCARPHVVSNSVPECMNGQIANDKPGITYDPVNNRVYITWTNFTINQKTCSTTSSKEMLRYYDVRTGQFSIPYTLNTLLGNGTAPVVTSSGLVYVFFLQMTSQGLGQSIIYFTFNNGTIATHPLANIYPVAQVQSTCGYHEAFTTQAFANNHYARTAEFPAAAVDKNGNIDVVWEAAPSNGGISTIFVATLPSGGGMPQIQPLSNPTSLIQWQPAIAFAGGTNTLAVTYFQIVQLSDGSYQIVREQATAPASSAPTFGAAKMISTVSWNALPTNSSTNGVPCYEGDYSSSVSTPSANVVWSYWGDNRNGSQADVYGLFANVP
jgi:hypothetical protein